MPAIVKRELTLDGKPLEIDGKPWYVLATDDDNLPVAKPFSESFSVFDARAGWDWIQEILGGTGFKVKRAGMLWNRSTWFYSVELKELNKLSRAGTVLNLNLANGLDGSLSRGAELSETTVCCANTLSLSRVYGQRVFQVKNTKNATVRMDSQREEIEKLCGMAAVWNAAMADLQKTPCQVQTAREIYAGEIIGKAQEVSTAARNKVDGLTALFQRGDGNRGETMADVLNGFTQYGTRGFESSKKDVFTRIESSEFGGMADAKAGFVTRLIEPAARELLRDSGAKSLALATN